MRLVDWIDPAPPPVLLSSMFAKLRPPQTPPTLPVLIALVELLSCLPASAQTICAQLVLSVSAGHRGAPVISPDTGILAYVNSDAKLRLHDVRTGKGLGETHVAEGETAHSFSTDNRFLLTQNNDSVIVRDSKSLQIVLEVAKAKHFPRSQLIGDQFLLNAVNSESTVLDVWDLGSPQLPIRPLRREDSQAAKALFATAQMQPTFVLGGIEEKTIETWRISPSGELKKVGVMTPRFEAEPEAAHGQPPYYYDTDLSALSPSGKMLATTANQTSSEGILPSLAVLFDMSNGKTKAILCFPNAEVLKLTFSACGRYLAVPIRRDLVQHEQVSVILYDVSTGEYPAMLVLHDRLDSVDTELTSAAFSPDTRQFFLSLSDGSLHKWDLP